MNRLLIDAHSFFYTASVPWPLDHDHEVDWSASLNSIETWLNHRVGSRYTQWAWHDSGAAYQIGVAFRWDRDRSLFVLTWS